MKKILWVSRHKMTKEQLTGITRKLGENFEIIQVEHTIKDINELEIENIDLICAVLPTMLLAKLVEKSKVPVIQSVSKRVEIGEKDSEKQFLFVHDRWEKIVKMDIIVEKW